MLGLQHSSALIIHGNLLQNLCIKMLGYFYLYCAT